MASSKSIMGGLSRLYSISRSRSISVYLSSSITNYSTSTSKPFVYQKSNKREKSNASETDDPDVFGTLSKYNRNHPLLEALGSEKLMDKEDLEEEKYISFDPAVRKNVKESELEIKQLIDNRKLKEAFYFLEVTMKEDKVKPSRGIYSMLIGACGRAGYTKKAFSLYNDMKKRGFYPTDSNITALFNACSNSPWPEDGLLRAKKLRQQLNEKNYLLNRQQYHAMIKAFGRCGDITTAFELSDEMTRNQLPITTETLSFLLQACISMPKDGFKHAIMVWRKMRSLRVTPNIHSYNLLLRATRDCGVVASNKTDQQSAAKTFLLNEGNVDPKVLGLPGAHYEDNHSTKLPNLLTERVETSNLIALTELDRSENRLALLGNVEGFLNEMRNDHSVPDMKTFTLLLESMASNTEQEKLLIEEINRLKIKPDVDFFNLLIKKRQFRADQSGALEVLNHLQMYQLSPNIMTFGVMALGCKNKTEALKLISTMEENGFRVNIEIFGSLLRNAVLSKKCWYIIDLLNQAVQMDLTLDEKALKMLDQFKNDTMEKLAKFDRGEECHPIYGDKKFRQAFKIFCLNYKPMMKELNVQVDPHPWTQYRYTKNQSSDLFEDD